MKVVSVKEREDGGADVMFDLTPEEVSAFITFGILRALQDAVKTGEDHTCEDQEE